MFATQRPQSTHLLICLIRARRRSLEPSRTGMRLGGLRLYLTAAWHSAALDHALAEGADPHTSAALAFRARKLTGPSARERVADGLARALRSAQGSSPGITAAVRPDADEVLDARIALAAVERRLRGTEAVTAQGVAMLGLLLTDGASPLYRPTGPGELASRLRAAAAALALQASQRESDATGRDTAVRDVSPAKRDYQAGRRTSGRQTADEELPRVTRDLAQRPAAGRGGAGR